MNELLERVILLNDRVKLLDDRIRNLVEQISVYQKEIIMYLNKKPETPQNEKTEQGEMFEE